MANKDTPYQTLGEFLNSPFGVSERNPKQEEYEKKYKELYTNKKIYCENWTVNDGSYMIHIMIPSESQQGQFYDVVVQFFSDDESILKQMNLGRYYIQVFSNSPSFIYQYATLYRTYGFLIESLYGKTDEEYSHQLPDKVNSDYKMSYDKSIYFACRFLQDNEFTILRKTGISLYPKANMKKFLRSIRDFETVKADSELYKLEEGLKKETEKEKKKAKEQRKEFVDKINPFSKGNQTKQKKKKAKLDTLGRNSPKSVHVLKKRKPSKTTTITKGPDGKLVKGVLNKSKKKSGFSTRKGKVRSGINEII